MQLWGPFTPTANAQQSVTVPQDSTFIEVENDCTFDLWVSFSPSVPPPGYVNSYNNVARISATKPIQVPSTPLTPFNGTIWVYAKQPGGLATAGTSSSREQFYVVSYGPGEVPQPTNAVPRATDLTSQSRIIAIPITSPVRAPYNVTGTGAPSGYYKLAQLWSGAPLASNATYTPYVYGLSAGLVGFTYAVLDIAIVSFANASIDNVALFELLVLAGGASSLCDVPPNAWATQFPMLAGDTFLGVYATFIDASPAAPSAWRLAGAVRCDVDLSGQAPPPSIGNGAATPGGVIY